MFSHISKVFDVCKFVSYSVARGSHILMMVMCIQLLHSLRLAPQCHAFI